MPHTPVRARPVREIGKAFGLGVAHHVGSLIEIEAAAFPAEKRKGGVRFNETAGSMARDSVFNAASAIRSLTGIDPADSDLHVNIVGGGNIDGPSAGLAIFLALYSALTRTPLPQNVAITGELSIAGKVRPVGGIVEKLYAARQAGMRAVLIPRENAREARAHVAALDVVPVYRRQHRIGFARYRAPDAAAQAQGRRVMATLAATQIERIPPHNLEAEMAVIGSILVDREMMATISEILQPQDFYALMHETIFSALIQLYDRGEPLDKITIAEELRQRNLLEKVGGLPYLSSLMETVPTAASAEYYARISREGGVTGADSRRYRCHADRL